MTERSEVLRIKPIGKKKPNPPRLKLLPAIAGVKEERERERDCITTFHDSILSFSQYNYQLTINSDFRSSNLGSDPNPNPDKKERQRRKLSYDHGLRFPSLIQIKAGILSIQTHLHIIHTYTYMYVYCKICSLIRFLIVTFLGLRVKNLILILG